MTKTFSFETPVNDGKTFIGNLLISGETTGVDYWNLDSVKYSPNKEIPPANDILPLLHYMGMTLLLTFVPVTAHLIKLWGAQEPEAFTENQKG